MKKKWKKKQLKKQNKKSNKRSESQKKKFEITERVIFKGYLVKYG